jgi:hypothetical protein
MKKIVVFCMLVVLLQNGKEVMAANKISFQIEMLSWKEVNDLLPRYSKFTVMDVETGKQFHVQRRAGSHHADVQPLTAKDTKIMKSIYGGKWSWKRRAIIIIHKDQWVAASMHGMPHGAGALKNNFPGHFCIHFLGSTTHRTNSMDLAHMLMIYKSAGKLDEYFWGADPYEVIQAYIAGLKQQDETICSAASLQKYKWDKILNQIESVNIRRLSLLPPEDLKNEISLDVPIEIDFFINKFGKQTMNGDIHLVRFSQYQPWKIDTIRFFKENHIRTKNND